jgi:RND family efflux transporter MFP subunit
MSLASVEKPRDPLASLRIPRTEPPRRRGAAGRWLRRFLILLVLAAVVAGGLYAVSRAGVFNLTESLQALQPKLEVRVGRANVTTGRSGDALVVATGYLEARQQARIGARAAGRIELLQVEEGNLVEKGHLLAVLEHADLEASLMAVRATLDQAKAQAAEHEVEIARTKRKFEREEKLRQAQASAESAYDDAKYQYESAVARRGTLAAAVALAEARVRESERMVENMFIRAPFGGTVISKDAELGESILPGGMGEASGRGSVATIADLSHLEVECDVKEDYISRVTIDQTAEVAVDAVPDRRYVGRVRKIIPMGDRARATIKVKVEILDADARLFPEMSSTVYFLPDAKETAAVPERRIFCPASALVKDGTTFFAWVLGDDDRVQKVEVKAGTENDGQVEILEGLSGGERLVVRPPVELRDGLQVKAVE